MPLGSSWSTSFCSQEELAELKKQLRTAQSDHESAVKRVSDKDAEVKRIQEELEKKETRLKQRNQNIKELYTQVENERSMYELQLKGELGVAHKSITHLSNWNSKNQCIEYYIGVWL